MLLYMYMYMYMYMLVPVMKKYAFVSGFYAMIRYIYSGKEKTIINITDLEQLFQVYILADKVSLYGRVQIFF